MEELSNLNVRSILVTSGTLSPLPSYSMELGIPFPHTLENPHIIQADQVHVRVIGKGVSGKLLSSSYERRQDAEYYSELGNTLASLSKVVPAGMLIFFPSYGVLETCVERWGGPSLSRPKKPAGKEAFFAQRSRKSNASNQYAFPRVVPTYNTSAFGSVASTPWKRLLAAKAVVVEPRTSADLPDAMSEFKRFLEMPKSSGCVLMGVCRGKISEGIDFAHDMSRAVIITGIPFAPSFDAKVKMKREFLDCARVAAASKPAEDAGFSGGTEMAGGNASAKLSGNEWYQQQAHRAVNQAIGRVIRNRTDYGAVLLLDSRFDQPRNKEGLSRWVRPHVRSDEGFGAAIKALGGFYREAAAQAKVLAETKPAPVEVAYEDDKLSDDDSVERVNRVALVKSDEPSASTGDGSEVANDSAYVAPDRVVARLEVDALATKKPKVVPKVVRRSDGARNFDAVFDPKRSAGAARPKPERTSAAAMFMEKTRSLHMKDQSSIRKLIVALKKQNDNKDIKGFRKSASQVAELVLQSEKHESLRQSEQYESPPKPNDERMLFLFRELVAPAYRTDFELIAIQKIVEISRLGQQCKENLNSVDCAKVFTSLVTTLHLLWFTDTVQESSFAQHAQVVVSAICTTNRGASETMLRYFLSLLPEKRREITRRLFDDIYDAKVIEQRKQQRKRIGEPSIDMNRFLPATTVNKRAFSRLGGTKANDVGNDTKSLQPQAHQGGAAAPSSSVTLQGTRRGPVVNPYKRPKTKTIQASTISTSRSTASSAKAKVSVLSSLLKTVESDPYVGRKSVSGKPAIQSNAPKGMNCEICYEPMMEPYIADCGHVACFSCWKSWLKRNDTCSRCRVHMTMSSIAQMVYQQESSRAAKTQPPPKPTKANEQVDSDGELELY